MALLSGHSQSVFPLTPGELDAGSSTSPELKSAP
jgi:hypothetical protein